jgi:Putative beta-lactamase-inhibitor-like, PepSY-like
MKSFLMLACFLVSFATISCSQKVNEKNLPGPVKAAFNTKFPGATAIRWSKENAKEYEAEFKLNGSNVSANFGTDGTWVETESVISVSGLPTAVSAAISAKYPGAPITLAEKTEQPGNKILYEVTIRVNGKKKGIEINTNGSFVK